MHMLLNTLQCNVCSPQHARLSSSINMVHNDESCCNAVGRSVTRLSYITYKSTCNAQ